MRQPHKLLLSLFIAARIFACQEEEKTLEISVNAKGGSSTSGKITFTEKGGQVTLEAHINGLTLGNHAIHIHETADCSSDDGKSAGGHWNPTFENHGAWGNEKGFHRGDIGNFNTNENGHGMITFSTDLWCLGCDDANKNIIGKAIIVHQGTDDLISQPSGAAGARVSCAGIIK
jgi:Cu-Zn family superoxide dismutase